MSQPIDPFEEYLRKKKVEMLEAKYRGERRPESEDAPEEGEVIEGEDSDRLKQEMDDFFSSGTSAGAEYFSKASELSDKKVDEIKDALDDVFEEDAPLPQAQHGETFVNFFQQVQDTYGGEARPVAPTVSEAPEVEVKAQQVTTPSAPLPPMADPEPLVVEDEAAAVATRRLNLAEILLGAEADLDQRVEVLCRIVAKLVERGNLPESEIIEALIKADVEF